MKRSTGTMILLLLGFALILTGCGGGEKVYKVGITQIVEHPSLDATREGFIAALKDKGLEEGKNLEIDVQMAQGDATNNMTIAQKFVSDKKDLILAISTPSAQSVLTATKDNPIPTLFTAITDPVGAGLVQSIENPGYNLTGTSDTHPEAISKTIQLIKDYFPDVKKVGIIYNAGEQNAVVNATKAKETITSLGLETVEVTIANGNEVKQAAETLASKKAQAFYIPKDNTVVAALESVIQVAEQNKIPLFVGEGDSVKRGGFASYGIEYFDLGYRTGEMAADILLNGKKPTEIPVEFPKNLDLVINIKAAEAQGIQVPEELKKNAVKVIE